MQIRWLSSFLLIICTACSTRTVDFEPPVRLNVGGVAIHVESPGFAAPCWADIDGDGTKELLVGQFNKGKIKVYRHLGGGEFEPGKWLQAEGAVAEVPGIS